MQITDLTAMENFQEKNTRRDIAAIAFLPPTAIERLKLLPTVIERKTLEELERGALAACEDHEECVRNVSAYFDLKEERRTLKMLHDLIRWEYLARQTVLAYGRELVARQHQIPLTLN